MELPHPFGNSFTGFQVWHFHGLVVGKFWASHCNGFPSASLKWQDTYGCYDAHNETKSGKILRIFHIQVRAVTNLPPLQESRPEILGLSEEGGVFLTKTSFSLPSGFFFGRVRPLDFEKLDGACHSSFSAGVYSYEPYRVVNAVF